MPIGGGGLNGNQNNPGVNSAGTPAAPTVSNGSTSTPGVGGTSVSNTNSASGESAPTSFSGTNNSMTGGFNPTNANAQVAKLAPQTMVNAPQVGLGGFGNNTYIPGTPGTFDPNYRNPVGAGTTPPTAASTAGPAIYGTHGNQTLGDWQKEQANTFNTNQLSGQAQWNQALGQMPYNTQINATNPYDQYVANPATPGHGSAAFQSPANAAAWNASGLASQVNPLSNPNAGFAQSQPQNPQYGQNQLLFLLNTLQRYGAGGQNQFGNTFSPTFTGQGTQGGLSQASSGTNNSSSGLQLAQLMPILLGLAQQGGGGNYRNAPSAGSYGNLGVANPTGSSSAPAQSLTYNPKTGQMVFAPNGIDAYNSNVSSGLPGDF